MPRAGRPCASESEGQGLSEDCPKQLELVRRPILHRSVTVVRYGSRALGCVRYGSEALGHRKESVECQR